VIGLWYEQRYLFYVLALILFYGVFTFVFFSHKHKTEQIGVANMFSKD